MKIMFNKLGTTLLLVTALCAPHANADMTTSNINTINANTANMLMSQAATVDDGPSVEDVDKVQREKLDQNIEMQEMILQLAAGSDDPVITERAEAAKLKIAEYKQELADRDAAARAAQEARHQAYLRRQTFGTAIINVIVTGIYIIGIVYVVRVIYNRFSAKKRKEKQK